MRQCRVSASFTHKRAACIKMAALPKRWRCGSFFLYNVDVTHKMATRQAVLPTRWRRFWEFTHKMAACIQDGGVSGSLPTRWRCAYKMVALPTRWWLYPQDAYKMATVSCFCEFYHKMAACIQDGGVTQKMVAREFFSYKMMASPTRWWLYHKLATRQFCVQDGGVTNKMVALPTRCLQDGDSAVFLRVLPTR